MAAARVSSIASVVSLRAKDSDGDWRDLTEGSEVFDRDEILCEADGEQYGLTAYKVQERTAAAWTDALTVTLNVPDGTSNYRTDRIGVDGDATDSTVTHLVTVDKGQRILKDLLNTLKGRERYFFTLNGGSDRFRGMFDDIEHGNKLEMEGFGQEFKGTLLCDREQFVGVNKPARGQKLKCLANGITYRIELVKEDEISYGVEFVSINK